MKRSFFALLGAGVLWAGLLLADEPKGSDTEPPVRLKKKPKPGIEIPDTPRRGELPPDAAEEEKKRDPIERPDAKDDPAPPADDSEQDEQEILGRVAKDMRSAEDRLANKDLGDGTRQIQRDILKNLDSLIDQNKRQNSSSSESSSSSSSSSKSSNKSSTSKSKQMASKGGRKQSKRQMAKGGQKNGSGGQAKDPGNQANPGAKTRGGDTTATEDRSGKMPDSYKDVWGHLPETLRAEMNAYASREEFMSKYKDLLKEYYSTIARKGQRKGD